MAMFASLAQASVLRVVVVDTDDAAAYTAELMKVKPMLERLGSDAKLRIWQARFAGSDTGTVVVTVEYADMATLVADNARAMADAEYAEWLAGLSKLRKIVSDSTYVELGE
jgi:hypothetical protein